MIRLRTVALVAAGWLPFLAGCDGEDWTGVIYPDRREPERAREIGTFATPAACRVAVAAAVASLPDPDQAEAVCGQGCRRDPNTDFYMCSRVAE